MTLTNKSLATTVAIAVYAAYFRVWADKVSKAVVPGTMVSLLSSPSKMPGKSFGLPARKACPRAAGSICQGCYAAKGAYCWKGPKHAQKVRFEWTRDSMRTEEGMLQWVAVMIRAICGQEYFRGHDSGDFFNVRYARAWVMVCRALPATKFWFPTRAWQGGVMGALPVYDPLLNVLRELASLPNVTVRPSALDFGDSAPVVAGLHAGSSADAADAPFNCPSRSQGNKCGDCRHCWDAKHVAVNYAKH